MIVHWRHCFPLVNATYIPFGILPVFPFIKSWSYYFWVQKFLVYADSKSFKYCVFNIKVKGNLHARVATACITKIFCNIMISCKHEKLPVWFFRTLGKAKKLNKYCIQYFKTYEYRFNIWYATALLNRIYSSISILYLKWNISQDNDKTLFVFWVI